VLVVNGAEHAVGGMPPSAVVVVDPGGNRVTSFLTGVEVVVAQQLPFQDGLERFRDRVIPRCQMRSIPSVLSELFGRRIRFIRGSGGISCSWPCGRRGRRIGCSSSTRTEGSSRRGSALSYPLTTRQASLYAADRSVAPTTVAFDAGLRPDPFPDRAASLLPGFLATTRTGPFTGRRRRASRQVMISGPSHPDALGARNFGLMLGVLLNTT
jgi:hypothetical protein